MFRKKKKKKIPEIKINIYSLGRAADVDVVRTSCAENNTTSRSVRIVMPCRSSVGREIAGFHVRPSAAQHGNGRATPFRTRFITSSLSEDAADQRWLLYPATEMEKNKE